MRMLEVFFDNQSAGWIEIAACKCKRFVQKLYGCARTQPLCFRLNILNFQERRMRASGRFLHA
jgi:hypothetical protein